MAASPKLLRRYLPRLHAALLALLLTLLAGPLWAGGSVEVIAHRDRAQVPLDRNLLRALFSMRLRSWPDGVPVRVFVLADDSALHDAFCREQLGIYPYVLRGAWDRMVYTGTGLAPTRVDSEAEMRRRVESTPGAIGYVWQADRSAAQP